MKAFFVPILTNPFMANSQLVEVVSPTPTDPTLWDPRVKAAIDAIISQSAPHFLLGTQRFEQRARKEIFHRPDGRVDIRMVAQPASGVIQKNFWMPEDKEEVILASSVAPLHAMIKRQGNHYTIEDLGSSIGTKLILFRDDRVDIRILRPSHGPVLIQDGDIVELTPLYILTFKAAEKTLRKQSGVLLEEIQLPADDLRFQPLRTQDGLEISYPFEDQLITRKEISGEAPKNYVQFEKIEDKIYWDPNLAAVYKDPHGFLLRLYRTTRYPERLLVLQEILEVFKIPHLRLEKELGLANIGMVVQEPLPFDAISLDDIARKGARNKSWEDMIQMVREYCGEKGVESLEALMENIQRINGDRFLYEQARKRGYVYSQYQKDHWNVPRSSPVLPPLIETLGQGDWSSTIFWHPEKGWFLVDW